MLGLLAVAVLVGIIVYVKRKILHGSSCCGEKEAPIKRVRAGDADPSHYAYARDACQAESFSTWETCGKS